jgi:hypothetical protein
MQSFFCATLLSANHRGESIIGRGAGIQPMN